MGGVTDPDKGMRRLLLDIGNKVGGTALLIMSLVLFLAGAAAGLSLISRLGGAGWIMYAVVIGSWGLLFGPIFAHAMTMHQNGSPRYREELRERQRQQRLKYGLPLQPEAEDPPARSWRRRR
jgi:hypothetical protein